MTTTTAPASPDLLGAIVAATRQIVEVRSKSVSIAELERRAADVVPARGRFLQALAVKDRLNVIAECKRRSPSKGVLKAEYKADAIAREYEAAGAAAISVLTEPTFFDGSLDDLAAVRRAVTLPVLRKDFIVDRYQILEARAAGADAILLIVAALGPDELRRLHELAVDAALDVLVEVHERREVQLAVDAGASIIGVNNRNLRTLEVDLTASERIIAECPGNVIAVAESGLKSPADLRRLRGEGYNAFLIGETLMVQPSPGETLRQLLSD
jgi:indole-3-glycerol phosphate synthase